MNVRARAEQYLAMRRSLGFTLRGEGRSLLEFADRLDETGQPTVTVAEAVAWASEPDGITAARKQRRLAIVRGFARYLAAFDPDCQVPPPGLLPGRAHRPTHTTTRMRRSRRWCTPRARSPRRCPRPPCRP
jgi:integrase/recombinase XerD